jgi:uncharacterized protein involved in exopolysaccharide biosynthesis
MSSGTSTTESASSFPKDPTEASTKPVPRAGATAALPEVVDSSGMTADPSATGARAQPGETEEEGQFDLGAVLDYALFGLRCLRRNALVAIGVAAAIVGASLALLRVLPRTYHVETTVLVQGDLVLVPLATGRQDDSTTTQGVADLMLGRENLISIIRQTNLVERWKLTRSPLHRVKDTLYAPFRRPFAEEELVDALIYLLEKQLIAWNDDRKVTIEVAWNDPGDAYRIIAAAQQNFLESRQLAETSAITDTIAILESHLAVAREQVETAVANARASRPRDAVRTEPRAPAAATASSTAAAEVSADVLRVRRLMEAKRRAVEDLEQLRSRRLAELQAQYTEQKAVYAESHPILVNLRDSISALSLDSPQLAQLRREAQLLEAEYSAKGGPLQAAEVEAARSTTGSPLPSVILRDTRRDPREEYAQLELTNATAKYNEILDRLNGARLALDTSQASFKYRYQVVRPPLPPKRALRPNMKMVLAAGVAGGLLAGVLAALGLDLRKGLLLEAWQIKRQLGVPLLAELPASMVRGAGPLPPPRPVDELAVGRPHDAFGDRPESAEPRPAAGARIPRA